jgi:hypothetical protein
MDSGSSNVDESENLKGSLPSLYIFYVNPPAALNSIRHPCLYQILKRIRRADLEVGVEPKDPPSFS